MIAFEPKEPHILAENLCLTQPYAIQRAAR